MEGLLHAVPQERGARLGRAGHEDRGHHAPERLLVRRGGRHVSVTQRCETATALRRAVVARGASCGHRRDGRTVLRATHDRV